MHPRRSQDKEFFCGITYKLIFLLLEEYQPDDNIGTAEQLNELIKMKLDDVESPKKLGGCMAKIVNKYQTKLDEGQKVAIIHKCGGKQYADVILQESTRVLADENWNPTAMELIKTMTKKFCLMEDGDKK